jgi:hypothetical protein
VLGAVELGVAQQPRRLRRPRGLAAEIGGPPDHDDERVQAIAARYDSVFVGPPL